MASKLDQIFELAFEAVAAPVVALQESGERVFLPYLFGSTVLAVWIWWRKLRSKTTLARFLFPRKIWLHESSLFDLRFMVVRALVFSLALGPLLISTAFLATWISSFLPRGAAPSWQAPAIIGTAGVSLFAFLGEDLARYLCHRLSHRVPFLWELHKVHHSAQVLTPLTVYRTHPLEGLMMRTGSTLGLALGAVGGSWLLGAALTLWEMMGVQGLSLVWNAWGANLRHSHVWLHYPRWLERILISPAQHQIHHSADKCHHDRNFGSVFALWDWALGSLYVPRRREKLTFGLAEGTENHEERVLSALFHPMIAAFRSLVPARWSSRPPSLPIPNKASYHSAR